MKGAALAAVLEFLAGKATQGPWRVGEPSFRCKMDHRHGQGSCRYEFDGWMEGDHWKSYIYRDKPMEHDKQAERVAGTWNYEEGGVAKAEDAELIITLVNNLPAILEALRRV